MDYPAFSLVSPARDLSGAWPDPISGRTTSKHQQMQCVGLATELERSVVQAVLSFSFMILIIKDSVSFVSPNVFKKQDGGFF